MDIARLLNDAESDQSDHEDNSPATSSQRAVASPLPPQWTVTPASPPRRSTTAAPLEKLVPTEPPHRSPTTLAPRAEISLTPVLPSQGAVVCARWRRPKKPSIKTLRAQRDALEFVVKCLPYALRDLDETSLSTPTTNLTTSEEGDETDAGDPDAQRMRSFLKRMVVLSNQAQVERARQTEYLRLLKRHYEGMANLRKLMRGLELDYWFWMCERWRSITDDFYEPLSESRCYAIIQETLKGIKNDKLPDDIKESDALGWQNWVQLDDDHHYVRFMTRKTVPATDVKQFVDLAWSIYQDANLYKKYHYGGKCEMFLQVVQKISPDVMVIQCVEKFPDLVQLTHMLFLIFRVQTETGYMIAVRSLESPKLLSLMKADGLSLCGSFFWDTFEVAHRDAQGECDAVRYTLAGSIGSDDPTYARRACDEILIALVRSENQIKDAAIVSIEPSYVEGNEETRDSHVTL